LCVEMPARSVLMKWVESHFAARGCRVVEKSIADGFLRFLCGESESIVRVVDELASRDEMLATIIQAAMESGGGKLAYVCLPMAFVSRVGDYAFRVNKIGVLVYDERDVVEIVEAGFVGKTVDEEKPIVLEKPSIDVERVERLENMLAEVLRRVEDLERRVEEMARQPVQPTQTIPQPTSPVAREENRAKKPKKPENLPSFIEDNPWVELLSGKK